MFALIDSQLNYLNMRAMPAPIVIATVTQCAKAKSSDAENKSPFTSRKTKPSDIFLDALFVFLNCFINFYFSL